MSAITISFVAITNFLVLINPIVSQKIEDRVVSGYFCEIQEIPFLSLLKIFTLSLRPPYMGMSLCGGSIISPSWILTAAHCLVRKDDYNATRIITAQLNTSNSDNGSRYNIDKLIPHPDYNFDTFQHDIGLLHMEKPLESPMIYPIFTKTKLESDKCTKGLIAGWGIEVDEAESSPKNVKCGVIQLVPKKRCILGEILEGITLDGTKLYGLIKGDRVASCHGDSGGPLVCDRKLIGLVSFNDEGCGRKGHCTFYTKIESYFSFIANYTGLKLPLWKPTDAEYTGNFSGTSNNTTNTTTTNKEHSTSSSSNVEKPTSSSSDHSFPNPMLVFLLATLVRQLIVKEKCSSW